MSATVSPTSSYQAVSPWPFASVTAPIDVAVDIKVVAGGIVVSRDQNGTPRRKLRASLVLSPKPKPAAAAGDLIVDLTNWPSEIETKLLRNAEKMRISVSCMPASIDAGSQRPTPDEAHRNRKLAVKRRAGDDSRIADITQCWQRLMGAKSTANPQPWDAFATIFGYAANPGTQPNAASGDGSDLLDVPRADMALFLQAWRARVVLGALMKDGKPTIEPGCDPIHDLKQWILKDEDLALLAGTAPPADQPGLNGPDIDAIRDRIKAQFNFRLSYLNAGSSRGALGNLDAFRCQETSCRTPLSMIEPVASAEESALHAMFRTHQTLHDAQLSLDDMLKEYMKNNTPAEGVKWKPAEPEGTNPSTQAAKTKLYGLQGIPALARVFRFVVDVEADLGDMSDFYERRDQAPRSGDGPTYDSLADILQWLNPACVYELDTVDTDARDEESIPSSHDTFPVTHYLFLSAAAGAGQPWTTAKLRYPTGSAWRGTQFGGKGVKATAVEGHFFPCTREEMDLAAVLLNPTDSELDEITGAADRVICRECKTASGDTQIRYMLPAVRDGRLLQYDGVLDLGAGRRAKVISERRPRYEIMSLDVISAMESQINLAKAESARREDRKQRKDAQQAQNEIDGRSERPAGFDLPVDSRPTYRTMGLTLVDRWRAAATAEALADKKVRQAGRDPATPAPVVFDATALTVGFRIDVGVRSDANAPHHFRALGNRVVTYRFPQSPQLIEDELRRLGFDKDGAREARIRLDSTPVVPGSRIGQDRRRFPEEILVSWEGDPLGLQCIRAWDGSEVEIVVDPAEDLGISRHYELPDDEGLSYRIPPLLFGKRYRYGMRAELQGGVTLPLERARALYEEAAGGMLALPEPSLPPESAVPDIADSPRAHGRRFLRHERILSPAVTVPQSELIAAKAKGENRLRDQGSREAVVRTATSEINGADASLDLTQVRRIFVAPGVSQNFAELHGVLVSGAAVAGTITVRNPEEPAMTRAVQVERPLDGLRNVAYNYSRGGFPIRSPDNAIVLREPALPNATPAGVAPSGPTAAQARDPVFVLQPTTGAQRNDTHLKRQEPYFPDPAAESMVFALRRRMFSPQLAADPNRDQSADYVDGDPVVIPLTHEALRYPDRMVAVLDVVRGGLNKRTLTQAAVLNSTSTETGTLAGGDFRKEELNSKTIDQGRVPARRITAKLAPGDDFDLDVWCVPSLDQLEKWFDAVESSAVLAVARSCLNEAGTADTDNKVFVSGKIGNANLACLAGIQGIIGDTDFASLRRRLSVWQKRKPTIGECGMGGLPLPAGSVRRDIAQMIREQMLRRPIKELAAVRSLRIAHAVSRPNFAPSFEANGDAQATPNLRNGGLEVIRRNFADDKARQQWVREHLVGTWHKKGGGAPVTHEELATDVLIGGSIRADLDSAHSVTIFAELSHPLTDLFDDERLGRRPDELGTELQDKHLVLEKGQKGRYTRPELYGFSVDTWTGQTSFKPERLPLARLEGLNPSDRLDERKFGTENVDVLVDARGQMRLDLKRYVPSDDKARKMSLDIETETRFRDVFEHAPRNLTSLARNALDELAKPKAKEARQKIWVTSRSSRENTEAARKSSVELWIPSTRRPQPIDPQSVLPAFVWSLQQDDKTGAVDIERRMLARLRFRRPWFSSGEGEKLGIALWPPTIFEQPSTRTEFDPNKEVPPDADNLPKEVATILRDQTRGGGYITRAGSDPIRHGGSFDRGDFMPLEAFRDAYPREGAPPRAQRVPSIAMPLPKDPDTGEQFVLHVALLTYEPLFDPIDETWYVDVEISGRDFPDGWVRFGLVRYQENAMEGRKVSEPTVAMVQILPRRRVRVSTRREQGQYLVTLTVEGAGSIAAADDDLVTDKDEKLLMQRPVVRPTLLKRSKLPDNQEEVDVLWCWEDAGSGAVGSKPEFVMPIRGDSGLLWSHTFRLDYDPVATESTSHEIVFDEVDLRPAATQDPHATSKLVASGPRFAARVRIPGAH
ncbi:hypothetical protein GGD65_005404 [Bradyrhizobium sp. CIR18]|uniref:hypothetical protein n=1 Tax=Bradyrhizobium sp. CIR18 TaxID=2663839 RepID=UPI001606276F|nr:hypothetical protein [Bradyrhizobium sp. CIR18]MBB4364346.1 hypothetical protein [Bradyrhizobium sp. CIR18]